MATTPKAKKPEADAPTAPFIVVSPLEHDGELYVIGETVELTEKQAEPLFGHTVQAAPAKA